MKSILFAREFVEPIRAGAKTATVRIDECEEIERGDRVRLVTENGQRFETARIVSTVETFVGGALHAIRSLDAHYPADSTQELVDGLRHHYGQAIGPRTPCRVLCWELVESESALLIADGGRPEPLRWRLSDDPPDARGNAVDEPDPGAGGLGESRDRDERAAAAEFLASVATADPDADPLADVEARGGHRLGCDPEAPHA